VTQPPGSTAKRSRPACIEGRVPANKGMIAETPPSSERPCVTPDSHPEGDTEPCLLLTGGDRIAPTTRPCDHSLGTPLGSEGARVLPVQNVWGEHI
jgi:hypothetical protein